MIGAQAAALYLPDRSDGRLGLDCSYNHDPEFLAELAEFRFERGEGLVGWIFKYRLPLNLCNVLNERELAEVPGKLRFADLPWIDPPVWKHFKHFDKKPQSYLGVPIILGDEVFGVLRFLKDATPEGFSYQDQQTMEQVAERISHYFYLSHIQPIRAGAYIRMDCAIARPAAARTGIAREIFEVIEQGLGSCGCGLRVLDETLPSSPPRMRLIAANDPEWLVQLPVYRKPSDPMIGDVWRKGKPRFVEDTAILRAALAGETTDWFVEKYQTMACFPLFAGPRDARPPVVGVLTVARDRRYTISAGDRRFLDRVAEIAGPYLVKVEADEEDRFRLAVVDAAIGRDGRHPACALLEPIKAFAEVDSGWAWRARPDGTGYEMACPGDRPPLGAPLDADTLHRLMASLLAPAVSLAPLVPEDQPGPGAVVCAPPARRADRGGLRTRPTPRMRLRLRADRQNPEHSGLLYPIVPGSRASRVLRGDDRPASPLRRRRRSGRAVVREGRCPRWASGPARPGNVEAQAPGRRPPKSRREFFARADPETIHYRSRIQGWLPT